QQPESFFSQREEDVVLARKVTVNGRRAVLDPLRNLADRDVVEAFGDEQLAGGVENGPADGFAVADVSFLDSHGSFRGGVRLQPAKGRTSWLVSERCSRV